MSNYTREARYETQKYYGGYCNMCRELNIEPVPYHSFNMVEYERVKNYNN